VRKRRETTDEVASGCADEASAKSTAFG